MSLTTDQEKAKELLLGNYRTFILRGYAGTGKSFLLNDVTPQLGGSVYVTAPTHKAVSIVKGDSTIHSHLGLKLINKADKKVLISSDKHKCTPKQTLIIDEASMISTELLQHIQYYQDTYKLKVIFVGDMGQLPPVGEDTSPVWDLDTPSFTLTEIVRQAADNPIIKLATKIRTSGLSKKEAQEFADGEHILVGNRKEAKQFFEDNIVGKSFPQIVSFRNAVVDSYNDWARDVVKDYPTVPYMEGENVYIRSTGKDSRFKLEEIVNIHKVGRPYNYRSHPDYPVNVMNMTVQSNSTGDHGTISVPETEGDRNNFETNKYLMAAEARKTHKWQRFWEYSEFITDVKHIYAMTCHRSQGSTFEDVIVNHKDIKENRMLYTAVTRASDRVFLLV